MAEQDFPPQLAEADHDRQVITRPLEINRSYDDEVPGFHLIINDTSYFIEKSEARRIARRILFSEIR